MIDGTGRGASARSLCSLALALIGALTLGACGDSGGSEGSGGSGGGGGSGAGCLFQQPTCSGCIAAECNPETDACYGAGWTPPQLCAPNGTSAACTTATSSQDGLKLQSDYAACVADRCLSSCE